MQIQDLQRFQNLLQDEIEIRLELPKGKYAAVGDQVPQPLFTVSHKLTKDELVELLVKRLSKPVEGRSSRPLTLPSAKKPCELSNPELCVMPAFAKLTMPVQRQCTYCLWVACSSLDTFD